MDVVVSVVEAESDVGDVPMVDVRHPFRRSAARAVGFDPLRMRREYRRLFHGIYISREVEPTPLVLARAVLVSVRGVAWASHATAARVLRLPIPVLPGEHVTVVDRNHRRGRPDITCHSAPSGMVTKVEDVTVSAPSQVFLELATMISLVDLVVVGDHMVRKGMISLGSLVAACQAASGPGADLAREAVSYVREGVDSPMETRTRMLIVLAGLPEPEVNALVGNETELRRYDLSYRASRTIVEYDGRAHIEREEQWESDLVRREKIDDDEWRIIVVIAKGIYKTPGDTLERIHRVLRKRGEPGVLAVLSDRWKAHFPGYE
nr:hypothetical protein [Nocardioides panzhihuensis]